jgi:YHS domain-containing protein
MRTLALTLLAVCALFPARASAAEFEGTCAWALAERGAERKTECSVNWKDPETGKTYCFSNEQTKMLFLQDPEDNIDRAEDAFARLRKKD